ncbi:MAG: two-component regulator propeller domain-containing protein, partial [Bacteroidales bacterium]
MIGKNMRFWIFTLLIFISISLLGIEENIRFRQLSPEDGFTYGSIHTIEQDQKGMIWFGTKYGLFRYNSTEIKKYSYNINDSNSLIDNRTNLVYKDLNNKLWITTESGLCFYNEKQDNFTAFPLYNKVKQKVDENIVSLFNDADGNLWMLSNYGVGKIDLTNHFVEFIGLGKQISPNKLYMDENQMMWLATTSGSLYR